MSKEFDEVLLHFGVKGMKWGVKRDLKKQGYSKKQIKYMNKKYKKDTEFEQRAVDLSKRAAKMVSKGKIGLQVTKLPGETVGKSTSRRTLINRLFSGSSKKKLESALGESIKSVDFRSKRKAKKMISKFSNSMVRVVNETNINKPYKDWSVVVG